MQELRALPAMRRSESRGVMNFLSFIIVGMWGEVCLYAKIRPNFVMLKFCVPFLQGAREGGRRFCL